MSSTEQRRPLEVGQVVHAVVHPGRIYIHTTDGDPPVFVERTIARVTPQSAYVATSDAVTHYRRRGDRIVDDGDEHGAVVRIGTVFYRTKADALAAAVRNADASIEHFAEALAKAHESRSALTALTAEAHS